jgi:glycosyltransferase involved in cell wall biosynthesis
MLDRPPALVVLLPVFNDWQAASLLIPRVVQQLLREGPIGVLVVDDGSTETCSLAIDAATPGLAWARVLRLRRNLGHQRAIAVGLSYIDEHVPCDAVIVMDADGEDRPEDLPRLVERYHHESHAPIVFAERSRRLESVTFRAFYALYRLLHLALTGRGVNVGNFSVVPRERLASLVVVSELWIHFAASAVRSRQPMCTVPAPRGRRLASGSRMSFTSLVVHGLSAISVYSDVVFTRLIVASTTLALLALMGMGIVLGIRLFSSLAIPGWTSYVLGVLLVVLLQAITFVVSLTFMVLGSRRYAEIIPRRDYALFVARVWDVPSPSAG